jgi:hypothetical protein
MATYVATSINIHIKIKTIANISIDINITKTGLK